MTLDRAWTRRPLVSPPWFGRSVPPTWTESEVAFTGADLVPDGDGGFEKPGESAHLTLKAHVEEVNVTDASPSDTIGTINRRMLRVFVPLPLPAGARLPRRGEHMLWTSDLGREYRVLVKSVTSPENLGDHLEIESEAYD